MDTSPQTQPSRSLMPAAIGIVALLVVVAMGVTTVRWQASGPRQSQRPAAPQSAPQLNNMQVGPTLQQMPTANGKTQLPDGTMLPVPFLPQAIQLGGELVQLGAKGGIEVWKVYKGQSNQEQLVEDKIYIIYVAQGAASIPFDLALTTVGGVMAHYVNGYGYRYNGTEYANQNAPTFPERFPGDFFATKRARVEDSQNGDALAIFEQTHGITFKTTGDDVGSVPLAPGYYAYVANQNPYTTFSFEPPNVCGDELTSGSEECDDGGTLSGDGCSDICQLEICGNSRVDAGEQCDDGNTQDGDGCSATCQNEGGGGAVCGDTNVDPPEECDDGKHCSDLTTLCTQDSDCAGIPGTDLFCLPRDNNGCSAICKLMNVCGNGIFEPPNEECDDGNSNNEDSCSNDCHLVGPFF